MKWSYRTYTVSTGWHFEDIDGCVTRALPRAPHLTEGQLPVAGEFTPCDFFCWAYFKSRVLPTAHGLWKTRNETFRKNGQHTHQYAGESNEKQRNLVQPMWGRHLSDMIVLKKISLLIIVLLQYQIRKLACCTLHEQTNQP